MAEGTCTTVPVESSGFTLVKMSDLAFIANSSIPKSLSVLSRVVRRVLNKPMDETTLKHMVWQLSAANANTFPHYSVTDSNGEQHCLIDSTYLTEGARLNLPKDWSLQQGDRQQVNFRPDPDLFQKVDIPQAGRQQRADPDLFQKVDIPQAGDVSSDKSTSTVAILGVATLAALGIWWMMGPRK